MDEPRNIEDLRKDVESRQSNVIWEDAIKGGKSVDELLWKGDSNAKPVQRAGMVVFGLVFWIGGVVMTASLWAGGSLSDRIIGLIYGIVLIPLAIRLFLNAFRRRKGPNDDPSQ